MLQPKKSSNLDHAHQRKQLPKSLSPVAVKILLLVTQLGVCAIEFLKQKNRVITKSVFAARLLGQHAPREIGSDGEKTALSGDRRDANKSRLPLVTRFPLHLVQKLLDSILVGCVRPGIARGVNSGRAIERRDYQT